MLFQLHKPQGSNGSIATPFISLTSNIPSYSIKVEGLSYGSIDYYYRNSEGNQVIFNIKQSGIHKLPICYKDGTSGTNVIINILSTDAVTITQLPSAYEGALVFDGVDDCGICSNLPILTDYTVICRRVIEKKDNSTVASKGYILNNKFYSGAFIVERQSNANNKGVFSFGINTFVSFSDNEIIYQTKNQYMSIPINHGDVVDSNKLALGTLSTNTDAFYSCLKGAIYYFALYDKSLTPEEIEEEKVKLENYWEGGKNELA